MSLNFNRNPCDIRKFTAGNKAQRVVEQWALRHEMIPEQLDPLAELLKDTYTKCRQASFKYYRPNSTKYDMTFWRYVATKVKDLNIDPVTYVHVAFTQYGSKAYPECLLSVQMPVLCLTAVSEDKVYNIEVRMQLYAHKIQREHALGIRSLEDILQDKDICGCPLFVWCMAVKHKLYTLAERYKKDADRLLMDPAYKSVYTRVFKEVFDGGY